jgi:hypothetical protein
MLHYFMILLEVVKRTPTPLNLLTYSVKLMSDTYIARAYHLSQHIVFFPLRDDELQRFYIFSDFIGNFAYLSRVLCGSEASYNV